MKILISVVTQKAFILAMVTMICPKENLCTLGGMMKIIQTLLMDYEFFKALRIGREHFGEISNSSLTIRASDKAQNRTLVLRCAHAS